MATERRVSAEELLARACGAIGVSQWQAVCSALHAYEEQYRDKMLSVTVNELPIAQGRAQAAHEILLTVINAHDIVSKINSRLAANAGSNRPDHMGVGVM